jgi:hypothetical protein
MGTCKSLAAIGRFVVKLDVALYQTHRRSRSSVSLPARGVVGEALDIIGAATAQDPALEEYSQDAQSYKSSVMIRAQAKPIVPVISRTTGKPRDVQTPL